MSSITINIAPDALDRLRARAQVSGKAPEELGRELLETALGTPEQPSDAVHAALLRSGRLQRMGDGLRRRIVAEATLEEVRNSLSKTSDPPLSEMLLAQRRTAE